MCALFVYIYIRRWERQTYIYAGGSGKHNETLVRCQITIYIYIYIYRTLLLLRENVFLCRLCRPVNMICSDLYIQSDLNWSDLSAVCTVIHAGGSGKQRNPVYRGLRLLPRGVRRPGNGDAKAPSPGDTAGGEKGERPCLRGRA